MDPVQISTLVLVGLDLVMTGVLQLRLHSNCGKGRSCIFFSEKDGNADTKEIIALEDRATTVMAKRLAEEGRENL